MTLPRKAVLYNELKDAREAGAQFDFPATYVSMTEAQLEALHDKFLGTKEPGGNPPPAEPEDFWTQANDEVANPDPSPEEVSRTTVLPGLLRTEAPALDDGIPPVREWGKYSPQQLARLLKVELRDKADDRAGLRTNTHGPDDVLRVDSSGKVWYQDEVPKPAIPKRRMRRKVRYIDPGVKTVERRDASGKLEERFEVAGDSPHEAEYAVTLPSWQTGIYYDVRLPFRVHVYNGRRGFDRMDVIRYYGGQDLVPTTVQESAIYVGNDLCYDILKVRDAMERELREKSGVLQRAVQF